MSAASAARNPTTFTRLSDTEIRVDCEFDAPQRLVYDAYTTPAHMKHWFGSRDWEFKVCDVDLRVGGSYKYHWVKDDKREMTIVGTYSEVDPPARLVFTEDWGADWPVTSNTVEFIEKGSRTLLSTTTKFVSKEALENALKTGMKHGWETIHDNLTEYLASI